MAIFPLLLQQTANSNCKLTSPFSLSFLEYLGDRSEAIIVIAETTPSMVGGGGVGPIRAVVDKGGLGKRFWIKV